MIVDGRRSTTEFPTYQEFMKGYINRIPGIYTCLRPMDVTERDTISVIRWRWDARAATR